MAEIKLHKDGVRETEGGVLLPPGVQLREKPPIVAPPVVEEKKDGWKKLGLLAGAATLIGGAGLWSAVEAVKGVVKLGTIAATPKTQVDEYWSDDGNVYIRRDRNSFGTPNQPERFAKDEVHGYSIIKTDKGTAKKQFSETNYGFTDSRTDKFWQKLPNYFDGQKDIPIHFSKPVARKAVQPVKTSTAGTVVPSPLLELLQKNSVQFGPQKADAIKPAQSRTLTDFLRPNQ